MDFKYVMRVVFGFVGLFALMISLVFASIDYQETITERLYLLFGAENGIQMMSITAGYIVVSFFSIGLLVFLSILLLDKVGFYDLKKDGYVPPNDINFTPVGVVIFLLTLTVAIWMKG